MCNCTATEDSMDHDLRVVLITSLVRRRKPLVLQTTMMTSGATLKKDLTPSCSHIFDSRFIVKSFSVLLRYSSFNMILCVFGGQSTCLTRGQFCQSCKFLTHFMCVVSFV